MKAGVRQLLGLAVAIISFAVTILICALPQWKVLKVQGSGSGDSTVYSRGLWQLCVTDNMYGTRCFIYENAPITQDLKAARALIIIAIIVGFTGILLGVAGSKFISFVPDERKKSKMAMASGVVFFIASLFVLIPVCWITNTINDNFNYERSPGSPDSLKWVLGASIYIGWITTGLWFLGGGLLCSSFLCRDGTD
ncbi:claudin-like protein ZF-A89 [Archocentrus centrarchus]|uniref:claudin-like protein ZF-A89 n=1 Tax=Archocentrus centrarchus TaxID=63155 RepID=UPI0011EA0D18|nr:claudin-like protein ZF-A89 [Archocentrus centrarchus]